ncbi:hypothetical protein KY334_04985 [Candidatus Woesearchaeota archaeon]|nr:hypothetical protein [Candidatus Woesearchaeota archaeon]
MNFKKISTYILIGILLMVFVNSNPSRINILNLNYNDGDIKFIEKTTKYGYYPDRLIQPEVGHNLSIVSGIEELYSFKFTVPNLEFIDGYYNDQNLGEIMKLNNVNFSLIVPSYTNEKEIIIYDENMNVEEKISLVERKALEKDNKIMLIIIGAIVLLMISIIYRMKNR